jgi:N-carbamoyl-L-amino-acid hydrolase
MRASQEHLREYLLTNGEFGAIDAADGHGRTVLTGSEADRNAREHLVETMRELDMAVEIDAVGNIAGRWVPDSAAPDAAPIAAGSHLDSVPNGGIFDGPLGVYSAIEAVRAMQAAGAEPDRPVVVVSFTEEEGGRFDTGTLGSSVATGRMGVTEALSLRDDDGVTLEDRLEEIGFQGDGTLDAAEWDAWFEVHIEQSRRLERSSVPVGIVTAITGIKNCTVELVGDADHAGGTHMDDRSDALLGAAEFVSTVNDIAHEIVETESEFAAATVGSIDVEPNVRNVVPGRVEISTDFRDTDVEILETIADRAETGLARIAKQYDLSTTFEHRGTIDPARMSDRCIAAIREASDDRGLGALELPSGGGHDSMNVARVTDAGMLFAPSRDGISHSPQEWTDWEDCARVATVLLDAIATLAGADSGAGTE